MYSFILGFHRRVWWPKCTPASRNSFIVIFDKSPPTLENQGPSSARVFQSRARANCQPVSILALRELEPLACALLAVFLPFFGARVACEEITLSQTGTQFRIEEN